MDSDTIDEITARLSNYDVSSGFLVATLDNGQIWEQAEYSYTYSYAFRPEVTIFPTAAGCKMKVEDEDEMVLVRRIK